MRKSILMAVACAVCAGSAVAALPNGYTELKYLKANGKQKLVLDYTPTATDVLEAKVKLASSGGTQTIWCSRGSSTSDRTMTLFVIDQAYCADRAKTTNVSCAKDFCLAGVVTTLRVDYGQRKLFVNGGDTGVTLGDAADFTGGGSTLALFHSRIVGGADDNFGTFSFYGLKVFDASGALVREYVPAHNDAETDGALNSYGVYETQEGKFFPSDSTEAFAYEVKNEYVLDVPAGTERTLTADDVAAAGTGDFVKAGDGTLVGNAAMAAFAQDIIVREGVYRVTTTNSLGTGVGSVFVEPGASIHNTVESPTTYDAIGSRYSSFGPYVKVYCAGYGFHGIGAITNSVSAQNLCAQVYLTGESRLGGRGDTQIRYGGFHAFGNKLHTFARGNNFRFVAPSATTFLADIDVEAGDLGFQDTTRDGVVGTTQNVVSVSPGAEVYLWRMRSGFNQQLNLPHGAKFYADQGSFNLHYLSNTNRWNGSVTLGGTVTNRTYSPYGFTFGGKVTGDGGFRGINTGWLRLLNGENDFTGGVTLLKGGLSLNADGALPAEGGPLTLKGSAQAFASVDGNKPSGEAFPSVSSLHLPDLVANGAQGSVSSVDARLLDSSTGSVKSVSVAAGNTLTVKGALRVLGETRLDGGMLKLEKSIADDGVVPGLAWWHTAYVLDGNGLIDLNTKTPPEPPASARAMGNDRKGCTYAYQTWPKVSGTTNNVPTYKQAFLYKGYIKVPGEEGADVTFNVFTAIARMCQVFIDGKMVAYWNDNKAWNFETGKEVTIGYSRIWANPAFTVKAGWRPIEIVMNGYYDTTRGPVSSTGWVSNFGVGIDWQGRCVTNSANYVKLQDPGDGSFLRATLDATTIPVANRAPTFGGALVAGPGSQLDLGGVTAAVPQLTGVPSVANGTLSVESGSWLLRVSDILDKNGRGLSSPAVVAEGAGLTFPAGTTTIALADGVTLPERCRKCHVPLLRLTSGTPSAAAFELSAAFRQAGFTLSATGDTLYLDNPGSGLVLFFR